MAESGAPVSGAGAPTPPSAKDPSKAAEAPAHKDGALAPDSANGALPEENGHATMSEHNGHNGANGDSCANGASGDPAAQNGNGATNGAGGGGGGAVGGARPKVGRGARCWRRRTGANGGGANDGEDPSEADSSDSDRPVVTVTNGGGVNGNGNGLSGPDSDADVDDFYIYTYTGSSRRRSGNGVGGANGGGRGRDNGGASASLEAACALSADLPKSFYPDTGSESEGGGGTTQGVSGPGQSNLSTEVAALLQSELASSLHVEGANGVNGARGGIGIGAGRGAAAARRRRRRRRAEPENGAAAAAPAAAPNADRSNSPEMDFLEMDFVDSGEDGDSDEDSGQGGDENVTETNEEDEDSEADNAQVDELPANAGVAEGGGEMQAIGGAPAVVQGAVDSSNPWGPSSPPPGDLPREARVPNSLAFDLVSSERGEKSKNSSSLHPSAPPPPSSSARAGAGPSSSGVTSAPAVTPVREDHLSLMVRSRSLNSPLAAASSARDCPALMARGESDPTVSRSCCGQASRQAMNSSTLVNMEVCRSRLSQREALLCQNSPPSPSRDAPLVPGRRDPSSGIPLKCSYFQSISMQFLFHSSVPLFRVLKLLRDPRQDPDLDGAGSVQPTGHPDRDLCLRRHRCHKRPSRSERGSPISGHVCTDRRARDPVSADRVFGRVCGRGRRH